MRFGDYHKPFGIEHAIIITNGDEEFLDDDGNWDDLNSNTLIFKFNDMETAKKTADKFDGIVAGFVINHAEGSC